MNIDSQIEIAVQHHEAGQLAEAEQLYRQILNVQPDHVDALTLLGLIALQSNSLADAIELSQRAVAVFPGHVMATLNLGNAYQVNKQFREAINCYQRVKQLQPDNAPAYNNCAKAFYELGLINQAVDEYYQYIKLAPNDVDAIARLGRTICELGRFQEAIPFLQHSVSMNTADLDSQNWLGICLMETGQTIEAISCFQNILAKNPQLIKGGNLSGNDLTIQEKHDQAIEYFQSITNANPDFAVSLNNLGNALCKLKKYDEAQSTLKRAVELNPASPDICNNYGNILADIGEIQTSIEQLRRAIEMNPQHRVIYSNLIYRLYFLPECDSLAISREHHRWRLLQVEPLKKFIQPHSNDRDPNKRLKIGFVSPDFCDHVIGRNFMPLVREHNCERFEFICYSNANNSDVIATKISNYADSWKPIATLDDEAIANMIRQDGIDILVDLAMHMEHNRLFLFARKPAPIQVTCFAYPGSTGLDTIDYRLTDPYLDPPGMFDEFCSEKSVRLPDSFWCYDQEGMSLIDGIVVNALPALQNKFITFGCLSSFVKINSATISLWAKVLHHVANSKLLILAPHGSARSKTTSLFSKAGIDASRIMYADHCSRDDYLKLYHQIDVCLETLPYNGHTTNLDGLWMGVPTISIIGKTVVGRAGLSQLSNLGLQRLVASSPEEYVKLVGDVVENIDGLAKLRSELRQRMLSSPLMDAPRFAQNIETAFRTMWHTYCANG